jgi:hypothetical protein
LAKITVITDIVQDVYIKEQNEFLSHQTFKDFEWVIVNDNYEFEKDSIAQKVTVPFIHIPPPTVRPYFATVEAVNEALKYSSGELVFFMVGYVCPHPQCLERHWELHQKYPKAFFSGRSLEIGITPEQLKEQGKVQGEDYRMGLYTHSLFNRCWLDNEVFESYMDGVQNWWAGRNDSAPMEALLEVNGLDMALEGRHGYQDSDLGQRMMIAGYRYILDIKSSCLEFPHKRGVKPSLRTDLEHIALADKLFKGHLRDGTYKVNPEFDLRKEREECLKKYQS